MKFYEFSLARGLKMTASASALCALSVVIVPTTVAQESETNTVEEDAERKLSTVTVTSRFREETVQDIGASIAAIGSDTLEDQNINDFDEITSRIVGLDAFDRGPNQNDPALRGIGNNNVSSVSDSGRFSPVVAQFFDDVPVSSATGSQKDFSMFDMDRVEVLRGPQPTLFGEGAVGGAIRFFSRNPDLEATGLNDSVFQADISQVEDGSSNYTMSGATSLTLVPDVLALRGVVNYREDGGFIDYSALGIENGNEYESVNGRLIALYEPNDELNVRLIGMWGEDESLGSNTVDSTLPPDALSNRNGLVGFVTDDYAMYSAAIEYDFGPIAVTSITSIYQRDYNALADLVVLTELFNGLGFAFGLTNAGNFTAAPTLQAVDDDLFSQEFRFVSDFEGPLNFVAGLNYQEIESEADTEFSIIGFGDPMDFLDPSQASSRFTDSVDQIETEQISGFAELTWDVSDGFRLIGGARYVREEINVTTTGDSVGSALADFTGDLTLLALPIPPLRRVTLDETGAAFQVPLSQEFTLDKVLPRAAFEYDLTDDAMVYGIVSTGARSGNSNSTANLAANTAVFFGDPGFESLAQSFVAENINFDQDEILSTELGLKSTWLDDTVIVNVAAYRSEYKDPQITKTLTGNLQDNGPDIENFGVEFESAWQVNENVNAYFNAAWQDSEFTDSQELTPDPRTAIMAGNTPFNVPEWSFSTGADLNYPLNSLDADLVAGVSYSFTDARFNGIQNFPSTELEPLGLLNARIGLDAENWSLSLYGKNLTNELEFVSVLYNEGNGATIFATPSGGFDIAITDAAVNTPRTIGVQLTLRH